MKRIICATVLLAASGAAMAQMPSPEEIMAMNDTDKDGAITKAEAEAGGSPLGMFFDMMDANADGKITLEEIKAMMAGGPPG